MKTAVPALRAANFLFVKEHTDTLSSFLCDSLQILEFLPALAHNLKRIKNEKFGDQFRRTLLRSLPQVTKAGHHHDGWF